jgi:hypothetical protein
MSEAELLALILSAIVVIPPGVVGLYGIAWLWKQYRTVKRSRADLLEWELQFLLVEDDDGRP